LCTASYGQRNLDLGLVGNFCDLDFRERGALDEGKITLHGAEDLLREHGVGAVLVLLDAEA